MEASEETQTELGWDDVAARIVIGLTVLAVVAFFVGMGIAMGWWVPFALIAVLVVAFLIGGCMEKWLYE